MSTVPEATYSASWAWEGPTCCEGGRMRRSFLGKYTRLLPRAWHTAGAYDPTSGGLRYFPVTRDSSPSGGRAVADASEYIRAGSGERPIEAGTPARIDESSESPSSGS